MFYANNEQVKGIFLNGRNYNYLVYGFGKIIPEDRNAGQLNLNLAYKYLNQYRIEWGTVKDGYENALVSPRIDKPDYNGVFHSPFTYYYNGNIISTKEVPVLITDGNYALRNALVYNDMNINGAINYFATNTDFQGHNVNTYLEGFGSSQSYFESTVMDNCSNFHLRSLSRFSKGSQPALYNCNNFSGWFNFVRGDDGTRYPGFMGFLKGCKDGVFNINCKNMHGGGSDANVTNFYNFSGIQSCNNINLNITGSSWQVWPHDHSFTSNCYINTYNVISGFSYMNDCNFNVVLPKDSNPEMSQGFAFLSSAENCNYNLNALDSNLFNYRSGAGRILFFENLNNCNLNLQVNNTVSFSHTFGNNFNNCNIVFDNIKADLSTFMGWSYLNNCNISGNVEAASYSQEFIGRSDSLNINLNFAKSSRALPLWRCNNVNGNLVAGDDTRVTYSNYINLNVSGGKLALKDVGHSRCNFNGTNASFTNVNNTYARVYDTTFKCHNTNNTEIDSDGGSTAITGADNCYNLTLSGLTFNTSALSNPCLLENVYNSNIKFGTAITYYRLWHVESCTIDGFPRALTYVKNCVFYPFNMRQVGLYNGEVGTWGNVWAHNRIAGIRSNDYISNCRIYVNHWVSNGNITFENSNSMQTSFGSYYNGFVNADLPFHNMNIKLNVDCNTLNLGIFQAGPPHGFQNATISANTIYAKGNGSGGSTYVQLNCDTKIYCENFCNAPFYPDVRAETSVLQPVVLINNYQHTNSMACSFLGGLTRIGRLNYRGGMPADLTIRTGACVFINNALLGRTVVRQNSLLFLGSNVTLANSITVESGGRVRNAANLTDDDIRFIDRGQLCWNLWDYGPWGSYRLIDYCTSV